MNGTETSWLTGFISILSALLGLLTGDAFQVFFGALSALFGTTV